MIFGNDASIEKELIPERGRLGVRQQNPVSNYIGEEPDDMLVALPRRT